MTSNADIVLDQFTRQATPFANAAAMRDEEALRLLVEFSGASANDTVLDVACGPGLVVAAFAKVCRHATGIDLTPAMIEKAREHAAALGAHQCRLACRQRAAAAVSRSLVLGRGLALRVPSFPRSARRAAEMARVATRPGRVVVADMAASDDPRRADALNRMERLRDPSHTRALTLAEMRGLFAQAGCRRRARRITTCGASSKGCWRPRFRRRAMFR